MAEVGFLDFMHEWLKFDNPMGFEPQAIVHSVFDGNYVTALKALQSLPRTENERPVLFEEMYQSILNRREQEKRDGELVCDTIGEVIASFMKRDTLDHYRRERDEKISVFDPTCTGHYAGCLAEAEEFVERLRTRGFTIMRTLDT